MAIEADCVGIVFALQSSSAPVTISPVFDNVSLMRLDFEMSMFVTACNCVGILY